MTSSAHPLSPSNYKPKVEVDPSTVGADVLQTHRNLQHAQFIGAHLRDPEVYGATIGPNLGDQPMPSGPDVPEGYAVGGAKVDDRGKKVPEVTLSDQGSTTGEIGKYVDYVQGMRAKGIENAYVGGWRNASRNNRLVLDASTVESKEPRAQALTASRNESAYWDMQKEQSKDSKGTVLP